MKLSEQELVERFELLDDWTERYAYLVELGRKLPDMDDAEKTEDNRVRGCVSQVWLISRVREGDTPALEFVGDSDAHIVRGLIALLQMLYSGRTPQEILDADIERVFRDLGLDEHLSPNRRNGFRSMVERIKSDAGSAAA